MSYANGSLVRLSAVFENALGSVMDPDAVRVETISPENVGGRPPGRLTSYTYGVDAALMKDSVGRYHIDVSVAFNGIWRWRWYSSGTGQAADEGTFLVESHVVAAP